MHNQIDTNLYIMLSEFVRLLEFKLLSHVTVDKENEIK